MRLDKLTHSFQSALGEAQSLAVGKDSPAIEPVHLMKALLDQKNSTIRHLLTSLNVDMKGLQTALETAIQQLPQIVGGQADVHISNDLMRILNRTDKYAQQRKDSFISSELFVLAALEESGGLGQILQKAGVKKDALEKVINELRGGQVVDNANAEEQRHNL